MINDLATGGAQRVVLGQAETLDRSRFLPEVASLELEPAGRLVPDFERAGIPVHRLRSAGEPPVAGVSRLVSLIRRVRPALVHTHLAAAGVAGRLAARGCGAPRIVSTLHNLSDWQERRRTPLRWLDRRTLPLADAVIAVSEAVRRACVAACPDLAPRTVTVPNGVPLADLADARRERGAMRAALGYGPSHFVVGAVARLDPRKGLATLLEALAMAAPARPGLRLLLVGDGPERERLRSMARTRGVADRVLMVGHQDRVRGHLAAMDLFAAPSRTEGLGLAIIEALAVGLPVLGARAGGIPEVVEDGLCGRLLPPDRPEAWADALARCAAGEDPCDLWAAAAPARAARFSSAAAAIALRGVYERVLDAASAVERVEEAA